VSLFFALKIYFFWRKILLLTFFVYVFLGIILTFETMKTNYSIMLRKFTPLVCMFAILFALNLPPQSANAQVSTYGFTFRGNGSALPAGNIITYGSNCTACGYGFYSIGFNFAFKGDPTIYSSFAVWTNGMISLNGSPSNANSNNLASTGSFPVIAAFWQVNGRNASGAAWYGCPQNYISYQTTGTAPNRVLTVQWYNMPTDRHNSGYYGDAKSTWQIRLYETGGTRSGDVELFYQHMTTITECSRGDRTGANNPTAASIGLGKGTNNFVSITPNGSSTNFTLSNSAMNGNINIQNSPIPDNTLITLNIPPNRQLSVSPKSLNFGLQTAGTSTSLPVTACNPGTEDVTNLTGATITGSGDFTVTGPTANPLGIGQCATYTVTYRPSRGGPATALLTINSNGRDSGSQTLILTGSGIIADLTYDSTSLFRRSRTRMGDTAIRYIHINSTGTAPLIVTAATLTGFDAGQYKVFRVPGPIQPGAMDSIGIWYIPTIEGKHIATLTVTSNAFTYASFNVSLEGTGILPHIVITPPTALLFDSTAEGDTLCKNITIWNPGTDTLRLLANFLSSNDGDFHYVGLSGSDTAIAPDQTKTVSVCFIPVQQGIRQGRLLIKTNIIKTFETPRRDTGSIYQIEFRGTGLPLGVLSASISGLYAPPLMLDSSIVGKQKCVTDTLFNNGDADLTVTGVTMGNTTDFSMNGLPAVPFHMAPRSKMVFNVCGKPTAQGILNSTISYTYTTGDRTPAGPVQNISIYGLKSCATPTPIALFSGVSGKIVKGTKATQCDTVTNCGEVAAVYTAAVSGGDASRYTISSPNPSPSIAPGDMYVFCVEFDAADENPTTASLDITSPDVTAMNIPLNGQGVCATVALAGTASVPNTPGNEKNTFTFTINNTGTGDWTPGTPTIAGTEAGNYKVISVIPTGGANGDPIPAGGSAVVTVEFHPDWKPDGKHYIAEISWPNGGPCEVTTLKVPLDGLSIPSSVKDIVSSEGFSLDQSYPNPTHGKVAFTYVTPRETEVRIALVDMTGKLIETLISGRVSEGEHNVSFDAAKYPSGTYIYLLESGSVKLARQLVLTK
jgi:hypothetical protein